MKKILFSLLTLCLATFAFSQTNIFPTTGNVGIGTLTPGNILEIKNINNTYLQGLNIQLTGNTGAVVDQTYGAYIVNNLGGGLNGPSRYGGYFEAKGYPSSNNYNYGLVGVGNKLGGYGYETIGVLGIARHTFQSYSTNNTNLIGVKGLVDFTDDGNTLLNTKFGASLYGEVIVPSNKTLTTYYGVYLKPPSGNITNKWGLFQVDAGSQNYLAGNLGIGTTSPSEKLDINGNINMTGVNRRIFLGGTSANTFGIAYDSTYPDYGIFYTEGSVDHVSISPNGNATNGVLNVRGDGHVGIGTNAPDNTLHIEGDLLLDVFGNSGHEKGIFFREGFSTTNKYNVSILAYDHNGGGSSPDGLSINGQDGISFNTGSDTRNERMRLAQNGNLGIGTASPTEKLSVDGTVLAKKVRVSTAGADWPDYVFSLDFKLKTLPELETYIKANKHLPEVPSAKEVGKEGLDLGKMDATLLKKVEELTLYLIEMNKNQEKLIREVEELKKENKKLRGNK